MPELQGAAAPSPSLYIGPQGGRRPWEIQSPKGAAARGVECPPRQVGRPPPPPRVSNPGRRGARGGGRGRTTCLGGHSTPPGRRPLGRLHLPRPAPPLGAYIKEGKGEGSRTLCIGTSLPLLHLVLLPQQLGEALPEFCCIHHHAVVLLDVHQPLLPPCWIKKEETSSAPYVC